MCSQEITKFASKSNLGCVTFVLASLDHLRYRFETAPGFILNHRQRSCLFCLVNSVHLSRRFLQKGGRQNMVENVQKLTFKGHVGHFSRKECFKMKISTFFKYKYNTSLTFVHQKAAERFFFIWNMGEKLIRITTKYM